VRSRQIARSAANNAGRQPEVARHPARAGRGTSAASGDLATTLRRHFVGAGQIYSRRTMPSCQA
jgi:hypothetical protein